MPVHRVVLAAVVPLVPQAGADEQPVLGRDGDVPPVEEPMEIGAQQQAIGDLVPAAVSVRLDVCGFEHGRECSVVTAHAP